MEEIFVCTQHLNVTYSDVLMMPTAERRFYLGLLVKKNHKEKEKLEQATDHEAQQLIQRISYKESEMKALLDKAQGFYGSIPVVGSSLPIAMGIALAEKQANSKNIVVAFVGDAVIETGQFYESLNFISLMQLPILIVLENNGYSTYAPIDDRQPKDRNLSATAKGFGISFFSANGDEIEAVVKLTKESLLLVRSSQPVLIELSTFRRYEHCGPNFDDDLGYRSKSEIKTYSDRDPLTKFTQSLAIKPDTAEIAEQIQAITHKYVLQVFEKAINSPQGDATLSESDAFLQ
jgi:pyruvate dehydrogenase E1 component alpha subunit